MKNFVLQQTDLLVFPLIAVVMFFAIFVAACVWVWRPGARAAYDARSRLALDDGMPVDGTDGTHGIRTAGGIR